MSAHAGQRNMVVSAAAWVARRCVRKWREWWWISSRAGSFCLPGIPIGACCKPRLTCNASRSGWRASSPVSSVCRAAETSWPRLFLLALRSDPQHFLKGGQASGDLLRARQAQAAHAFLEGMSAQRDQVGIGGDQGLHRIVDQHDFIPPRAAAVAGIAAFQATYGTAGLSRQWCTPGFGQALPTVFIQRLWRLAMRA